MRLSVCMCTAAHVDYKNRPICILYCVMLYTPAHRIICLDVHSGGYVNNTGRTVHHFLLQATCSFICYRIQQQRSVQWLLHMRAIRTGVKTFGDGRGIDEVSATQDTRQVFIESSHENLTLSFIHLWHLLKPFTEHTPHVYTPAQATK